MKYKTGESWAISCWPSQCAAHRISKQKPRRMRVCAPVRPPSRYNSWTNYCNANYYVLMFTSANKTNAEIKWVFITTKTQRDMVAKWKRKCRAKFIASASASAHVSAIFLCGCNSSGDGEARASTRTPTHSPERINNLRDKVSGNKTQTKSAGWATQHKLKQTMAKSEKKKIILTSKRVKLSFISHPKTHRRPSQSPEYERGSVVVTIFFRRLFRRKRKLKFQVCWFILCALTAELKL